MTAPADDEAVASPMDRWLPYLPVGLAIPAGLVVLLFEPLPWPAANRVVGWAVLAVAAGSVLYLVARHAGPGERGPDF